MREPVAHNGVRATISSKQKGPGEEGAAGYCPKVLLLKRAKMVLRPFHRSHREICTRNRPVSETKFLDDFWGPLSLPGPFVLLLIETLAGRGLLVGPSKKISPLF